MPFLEDVDLGHNTDLENTILAPANEVPKVSMTVELDGNGGPSGWVTVSPYTGIPHLLDLTVTGPAQGLLAKALTLLVPIRKDYATAAYNESFNWTEVMAALKSLITTTGFYWKPRRFFIVVFRSQVKASTDRSDLGELYQRSHAEATSSGGLLKYWFGIPDARYRNLATCENIIYSRRWLIDNFQAFGIRSKTLSVVAKVGAIAKLQRQLQTCTQSGMWSGYN